MNNFHKLLKWINIHTNTVVAVVEVFSYYCRHVYKAFFLLNSTANQQLKIVTNVKEKKLLMLLMQYKRRQNFLQAKSNVCLQTITNADDPLCRFIRVLKRRCDVLIVDENNTTKACSICYKRLEVATPPERFVQCRCIDGKRKVNFYLQILLVYLLSL